ncbi:DNA-binding protein [bacterium]|nr:MAG: DNA-binding protein [bacterium]
MEPINLTPRETMRRLRVGRTKLYELIAAGKLAHFRVGRKILVPVRAIEALERGASQEARR